MAKCPIITMNTVTFTPQYLAIATSVTNNDSSTATATVTIDDGYAKAAAGEAVSFSIADITAGYNVASVGVSGGSGAVVVTVTNGVYSFTMPDSAATINVGLAAIVPRSITIDSAIIGGTVTATPTANVGDVVTVSVTPDENRSLATLQYYTTDSQDLTDITATEGVYSFAMPDADVTLTATFIAASSNPEAWDGSIDTQLVQYDGHQL